MTTIFTSNIIFIPLHAQNKDSPVQQTIFHIWKINKNSLRHEIILYFYQYRTDFGFSDMLTSTAKSMDIW